MTTAIFEFLILQTCAEVFWNSARFLKKCLWTQIFAISILPHPSVFTIHTIFSRQKDVCNRRYFFGKFLQVPTILSHANTAAIRYAVMGLWMIKVHPRYYPRGISNKSSSRFRQQRYTGNTNKPERLPQLSYVKSHIIDIFGFLTVQTPESLYQHLWINSKNTKNYFSAGRIRISDLWVPKCVCVYVCSCVRVCICINVDT